MYKGYRASSVPPGVYQSAAKVKRMPSYCPPHGKYYGTSTTQPKKPNTTTAVRVSCKPSLASSSTKYFDPVYPSRQFGTRLSKGYSSSVNFRPELYEQAYGESFLPGFGRDSYSAYKIADATFDDADDIVSASLKKDTAVMQDVERTMRRAKCAKIVPDRRHSSSVKSQHRTRASSVPPSSSSVVIEEVDWPVSRILHDILPSVAACILHAKAKAKAEVSNLPPLIRPATVVKTSSETYQKGLPAAKISKVSKTSVKSRPVPKHVTTRRYRLPSDRSHYTLDITTKKPDILSVKERMCAKELVDLSSPSATLALKMRVKEAQNSLAKQSAMIDRYYVDKDNMEVDAELRRIKSQRALRAQSVY